MKYNNYAKEFTKEELIKQDYEIRFDEHGLPHVFHAGKEVKLKTHITGPSKFKYLCFMIFDLDKNGNRQIMESKPNWKNQNNGYYVYRYKTVLLHRAVWAWVYGKVEEGMVINHIDNDCDRTKLENYAIDKLEQVSIAENLNKYKTKRAVIKNKRKVHTVEELDKKIAYCNTEYEYYRALGNKDYANECKSWRCKKAYYEALKRGLQEKES